VPKEELFMAKRTALIKKIEGADDDKPEEKFDNVYDIEIIDDEDDDGDQANK
jgi:hypothetical protein